MWKIPFCSKNRFNLMTKNSTKPHIVGSCSHIKQNAGNVSWLGLLLGVGSRVWFLRKIVKAPPPPQRVLSKFRVATWNVCNLKTRSAGGYRGESLTIAVSKSTGGKVVWQLIRFGFEPWKAMATNTASTTVRTNQVLAELACSLLKPGLMR